MIKEEQLLEQKELRDQLIEKTDALREANKLLLIHQTELATVKQVAEYYKVGEKAIQSLYVDNKEELDEAGVTLRGYKEFSSILEGELKTAKGKATFIFENGEFIDIPTRGLKVFPLKAILKVGMLLRDSEIAKKLRTILANMALQVNATGGYVDENREEEFLINYFPSFSEETKLVMVQDLRKQNMKFKNDIEKLQQDNKALAGEILKWENRSKMVFAIRKLALMLHKPVSYVWSDLYKELKYKHHIDVKMRGNKPYIEHVKPNEWSKVIQSFSAICEDNTISPSDILNNLSDGGQGNE